MGEREHAGDDRLRGDHGRQGGEPDHGVEQEVGDEVVEGVVDRLGVAQQQGALAEVVEHQRRQHQPEPGEADRRLPEVPHVGVERLRPGHRQHDGAQRHEGAPAELPEQGDAVERVDGAQHPGCLHDLGDAERRQDPEPEQHDGAEEGADAAGAAALDGEEGEQHHGRERQDVGRQRRGGGLQPLDRRHDRDRGRDQPVAVEQRQAGEREDQDQELEAAVAADRAGGQRAERQHAALAAVVGAQDERRRT